MTNIENQKVDVLESLLFLIHHAAHVERKCEGIIEAAADLARAMSYECVNREDEVMQAKFLSVSNLMRLCRTLIEHEAYHEANGVAKMGIELMDF